MLGRELEDRRNARADAQMQIDTLQAQRLEQDAKAQRAYTALQEAKKNGGDVNTAQREYDLAKQQLANTDA